MKTRTITALVCIVLFIPFLVYSHTWAFPAIMSLLSLVAVYEMLGCIGMRKNYLISLPAYLLALGAPVIARYYNGDGDFISFAFKIFFTYMFYLFVVSVFSKGKTDFSDVSTAFVMIFYIVISFSCIVLIRDLEYGKYIYLLVFIFPWITDSFAYFCGRLFGRHKLIPDVSPKKTVEGAVGGTVFCILAFLLYGFIAGSAVEALQPDFIAFIIIGFVMAVISQCGDLVSSLIKRKYEIKDYGKILPGHGGIMDRFDSVIASAPFILILYELSNIFKLFK